MTERTTLIELIRSYQWVGCGIPIANQIY